MKNILKRIGLIALALFLCVGSLFMTNPLHNKSNNFASASYNPPALPEVPPPNDFTEYDGLTFTGSDFFYATLGLVNTSVQSLPNNDFASFNPYISPGTAGGDIAYNSTAQWFKFNASLTFAFNTLQFKIQATSNDLYFISGSTGIVNDIYGTNCNLSSFNFNNISSNFQPNVINRFSSISPFLRVFSNNGSLLTSPATYYANTFIGTEILYKSDTFTLPSLEIVSIDFTNSFDFQSNYGIAPAYSYSNIVIYTDTAGYSFVFYIPSFANYTNESDVVKYTYFYKFRRYFTENALNFTDNDYYNQGVSDGYSNGFSAGESAGYNSGFSVGEQQGYINGRQDGIESASEYTFLSLMTAVVDAPLLAFTSLFDFDLLGVNLLGFFIGLFTFSLVIIIAKFAIGGK